MPTSGGLYYWTHYFASPKTRNALSFLVGYSNTLGKELMTPEINNLEAD